MQQCLPFRKKSFWQNILIPEILHPVYFSTNSLAFRVIIFLKILFQAKVKGLFLKG